MRSVDRRTSREWIPVLKVCECHVAVNYRDKDDNWLYMDSDGAIKWKWELVMDVCPLTRSSINEHEFMGFIDSRERDSALLELERIIENERKVPE